MGPVTASVAMRRRPVRALPYQTGDAHPRRLGRSRTSPVWRNGARENRLLSAEVLVISGGPAGAAVAARLAARGCAVIFCERQARPRPQVCGEFISASAVEELQDLEIVPTLLGAAEIRRARLVLQERTAEASLPFVAYGLSRMRLDASLLDVLPRARGPRRGGVPGCARLPGPTVAPGSACSGMGSAS